MHSYLINDFCEIFCRRWRLELLHTQTCGGRVGQQSMHRRDTGCDAKHQYNRQLIQMVADKGQTRILSTTKTILLQQTVPQKFALQLLNCPPGIQHWSPQRSKMKANFEQLCQITKIREKNGENYIKKTL